MTTLRTYLSGAGGTVVTPAHPVPMSPEEALATLGRDEGMAPGYAAGDISLLDLEVDVEEQPGGDRWIYPVDRALLKDPGPILVHQPED